MRTPTPYWVVVKTPHSSKLVLRKYQTAAYAHALVAAVRNIPEYSSAYVYYAMG